jgi:hypothetical protein
MMTIIIFIVKHFDYDRHQCILVTLEAEKQRGMWI